MGGGGNQDVKTTVRHAEYLEAAHQALLWHIENQFDDWIDNSAYAGFVPVDLDPAFFGIGFIISSFPSLYDMYGKFMAGLDVDALYNQIFLDTTTGPLITNLVGEQAIELADDLETNILPRYETGMRDINAVMSSTYAVGKALIENTRIKALSKYDAELRYRLIPTAGERWGKHLDWNKNVVEVYGNLLKLYVSARIDVDNQFYDFKAKNSLWNFTVFENYRLAIGTLTGATRTSSDGLGGPTQGQKALAGAMSGAAIGTEINAGWGTAIGAVVGAAAGYFM
jgi:hypothetical protein